MTAIQSTIVELTEASSASHDADVIARATPDEWKALGVTVERRIDDDPAEWRLRAGNIVGVAEIGPTDAPLRVRIRPKLRADLFALADWAFAETGTPPTSLTSAQLANIERDPAACIIAWYLQALESFAVRWLRRSSQHRDEVLTGRVRGQILTTEYVGRYVSTAQAHRVPCRYVDMSRDTLVNRVLLRALRHVVTILPAIELPIAREQLRAAVNRIEPLLAGVTMQNITAGDFVRIRFAGPHRHYKPIITKSRAILQGMFATDELGANRQPAFVWSAPRLFQEALRGLLRAEGIGDIVAARPRLEIAYGDTLMRGGLVDPDYVVVDGDRTLLLDAKWKDIGQGNSTTTDEQMSLQVTPTLTIKVGRADIYQAVSYRNHESWTPATVGLVYPIALPEGSTLPTPRAIGGFGLPVWVFFLDVGMNARVHRRAFFEQVADAWAKPLSSSAARVVI